MGTNYYFVKKNQERDEKLKLWAEKAKIELEDMGVDWGIAINEVMRQTHQEMIHIGKNSMGWRFALASDNFKTSPSIEFFLDQNPDYIIEDEYGNKISLETMYDVMESILENPIRDWNGNEFGEEKYDSEFGDRINEEGFRLISGEFC